MRRGQGASGPQCMNVGKYATALICGGTCGRVPSWERITLLYLERTLHFLSLSERKGAGRAVSIVTMLQAG